ncbi:hypothetical protein [Nonomuraea dietziae]|uniref:hypothetical protein n=1 Tax=Nonomuraea dietziae TaxID=65515 RepID=UPI00340D44F9
MVAAAYDLLIEQGTHYERVLRLTTKPPDPAPLDLTGSTVRDIRVRPGAPELLYELSAANGRLVITNPAGGVIRLRIPGEDSTAWTWRTAVYDLELVDAGGQSLRLMRGAVRVSPEVTR